MLKSPKAQMAVVLAIGLLTGYAASSRKLNPFQKADAGTPEPWATQGTAGRPREGPREAGVTPPRPVRDRSGAA